MPRKRFIVGDFLAHHDHRGGGNYGLFHRTERITDSQILGSMDFGTMGSERRRDYAEDSADRIESDEINCLHCFAER
jgi:hypothetical protein